MTSPKALLLDYGGVMTTSVVDSFAAFCSTEGIDAGVFREVVLEAARTPDSAFVRVETGAISQEDFDREVALLLTHGCGVAVEAAELKQRLFAGVRPDDEMVAAVRAARRDGIATAMVSNSWGGDYPFDDLDGLFDALVISGDVRLRKPDPEIYLLAADRLGVAPDACVFVDDFRVNVDGARAVGMLAVYHRSAAGTIPQLETLLGVRLRG